MRGTYVQPTDFQAYYDSLRELLFEFKTEILAEQKMQLEVGISKLSSTSKALRTPMGNDLLPIIAVAPEVTLPFTPRQDIDHKNSRTTDNSEEILGSASQAASLEMVMKRLSKTSRRVKHGVHSPTGGRTSKQYSNHLSVPTSSGACTLFGSRQNSPRQEPSGTGSEYETPADRLTSASNAPSGVSGEERLTLASIATVLGKSPTRKRFNTEFMQKESCLTVGSIEQKKNRSSTELRSLGTTVIIPTFRIFQQNLQRVVKSPQFDCICGIVICLNAILLGIETEHIAQVGTTTRFDNAAQLILNTWYCVELLLRLAAFRWMFFTGEDAGWNLFDLVLVLSALVDVFLSHVRISSLKSGRMLRAVRLFRIVRTIRIVRHIRQVREFRKMVCSLTSSVTTLLWSMLLVCSVMYCFALWFTQAAAYLESDNADLDPRDSAPISEYYSSLSRTSYTLFAAISGGYSWHVLLDPWLRLKDHHFTVGLFFTYISITVFGLLNIVTSVFVESAMHATKHFQDLLLDEKKKELEMYTRHMQRIFNVIDADGGGTISFEEMEEYMNDSSSDLPHYFEALGITASDVWVLFKLLDKDDSGAIDMQEFCEGCMRLKGEARSFDISCMMYENRALLKHSADFMDFVEWRLEEMELKYAQWLIDLDQRFGIRLSSLETKFQVHAPELPQCWIPMTPRNDKDRKERISYNPTELRKFAVGVSCGVLAKSPREGIEIKASGGILHTTSSNSVLTRNGSEKRAQA